VAATKKGISGLLKRKNKNEKKASTETKNADEPSNSTSCLTESLQIYEGPSSFQTTTCQNSKCGKIFDRPLELIDLANPTEKGAYVCPHCLCQIETAKPEQEIMAETEVFTEEKIEEVAEEKDEKCPHFIGYLGKRPKSTPIPESCLTCEQMMKCLLGQ
jgi:hypothetical protein